MDIQTLCHKIHLQPEISRKVLAVERSFDFNTVSRQLGDFLIYQRMGTAHFLLPQWISRWKQPKNFLRGIIRKPRMPPSAAVPGFWTAS